jgi:hypothetical protein
MLLFYIDEFGDHSLIRDPHNPRRLKAGVSPWFVLAAVGFRDTSRANLAEALTSLKEKHFGADSSLRPWAESEIKGRHLVRATRRLSRGQRIGDPPAYSGLTEARLAALTPPRCPSNRRSTWSSTSPFGSTPS